MGGSESLGISKAGQTVLTRLMESQMCTSLPALWREGLDKGRWLLLALMPDTSVSPYITMVPFKLLPWCWSSEGVSLSMGFLKVSAWGSGSFFHQLNPTDFCSQKLWGLIFLAWNPGLGARCGSGTPYFCDIPPEFLSITHECGISLFESLPLLPVWMDVVSLIP